MEIACVQDQMLQLLDGVSKLFSSSQGLSAAIYTQVSDVEAEVNGASSSFYISAEVSPVNDIVVGSINWHGLQKLAQNKLP